MRALVETGFLLALNPDDSHHKRAVDVLEKAKKGEIKLYISSPSLIELSLLLRSRGLDEDIISTAFISIEDAIKMYTKVQYACLKAEHLALSAELRKRYKELTFFDSLHASIAIVDRLEYLDLDPVIREVVEKERSY